MGALTVGGTSGGIITTARSKPILCTAKSAETVSRNGVPAIRIIPASTDRATLSQWTATGKLSVGEIEGTTCRIL